MRKVSLRGDKLNEREGERERERERRKDACTYCVCVSANKWRGRQGWSFMMPLPSSVTRTSAQASDTCIRHSWLHLPFSLQFNLCPAEQEFQAVRCLNGNDGLVWSFKLEETIMTQGPHQREREREREKDAGWKSLAGWGASLQSRKLRHQKRHAGHLLICPVDAKDGRFSVCVPF